MKELKFPDFPREEYIERYDRTQKTIRRHGIDALFLTQRQNLRYFAGLRDGGWDAHHFYFLTILPAEGEPVLMVASGFDYLMQQCWIEDVRYWDQQKEFYMSRETNSINLVIDTLKERGLENGVIGMELSSDMQMNMGQLHIESLRHRLKKAKIVDGSEAVWEIRCIKSSAEISRLRKAADISVEGVRAGFENLKPGMTEKQMMEVMLSVMCAEGASEQRFSALYAGQRGMWADGLPTNNVIQMGDLVQFDGGCIYEGYWCDFKRMAAIGTPRPDQRHFFELAKEGLFAAIDTIKPGVPLHVPFQAAFAVNNTAGYSDFSKWCLEAGYSAIGHSLGLDIHEPPGIGATSPVLFQENMVLCVEPFITLDGIYPFWEAKEKFGLEDVVLVTKDGSEILTAEDMISHDLWIV